MTCGVALLLEWYRRSLGPGLSIERSRDKGLESDVDMRDATRTSCCVSRGGRNPAPLVTSRQRRTKGRWLLCRRPSLSTIRALR